MPKILYAYPEPLPSQKARSVQVTATCAALARKTEVTIAADIQGNMFSGLGISRPEQLTIKSINRNIGPIISNMVFNWRLDRLIRTIRFDVIISRHPKLAAKLCGKGLAVIFEVHEILKDKHPGRKDLSQMEKQIAQNAKGLIFISEGLQRRWEELYKTPPCVVIPSGTFCNNDFPEKDRSGPVRQIHYAGTTYYKWKGIETLFSALNMLHDLELVMIGETDVEIIPEPVRQRVRLLGHLTNKSVRTELQKARIALLPNSAQSITSRLYTSPLKLLEYMSNGVSVVASDLPSIREIVSEKECVFFTPDSPEDLAKAILTLVNDPGLEATLSMAGWKKAKEYSWDARAEKILTFAASLGVL
ncbi:MAG: glycosyltransferase family 4 protein [Deltaproteobacteria bacterium]|nr:glycosyltransferase family 4 protein [Deltaproteobacteria bacterium]MBW1932652.1 glycosyltransferase family 4 protein [Deltaproteobacteria bacterium]MBW2079553.1 glycosyltransferase family 4 protein [Deltaproteobacteria bacterium]MBW2351407.1 glycosyltransferase family 4 protein [Deltaproteobacteria bacterium]